MAQEFVSKHILDSLEFLRTDLFDLRIHELPPPFDTYFPVTTLKESLTSVSTSTVKRADAEFAVPGRIEPRDITISWLETEDYKISEYLSDFMADSYSLGMVNPISESVLTVEIDKFRYFSENPALTLTPPSQSNDLFSRVTNGRFGNRLRGAAAFSTGVLRNDPRLSILGQLPDRFGVLNSRFEQAGGIVDTIEGILPGSLGALGNFFKEGVSLEQWNAAIEEAFDGVTKKVISSRVYLVIPSTNIELDYSAKESVKMNEISMTFKIVGEVRSSLGDSVNSEGQTQKISPFRPWNRGDGGFF